MIYNVNKIENWFDDFTSCKNKFVNTYFDDYQDSYIRTCGDDIVRKMKSQLDNHYNKIKRIYDRINSHWNNYLNDLKNIDNCIAGTARPSSVNASAASAKLSALPNLRVYESDLTTKIESVSASIGTVSFLGWSEDKTLDENLKNSFEVLYSTGAVVTTSVVSGVFGLVEDLGDGILLLGTQVVTGAATWIFGEEEWAVSAQNTMMDAISYDVVGEINKQFYENTTSNMLGAIKAKFLSEFELALLPVEEQRKIAQLHLLAKRESQLLRQLAEEKEKYYTGLLDKAYQHIKRGK